MGKGLISFIIAGLIYIVGYWLIAGHPPGVKGAMEWWSILILFLLWGAVDAVFSRRGD